jgi:hypothetical protein
MQIHQIDTGRRSDVRQFIRFPFELYDDCPQWVPPLIPEMTLALDRDKYPFYRNSEADFFTAKSKGKTLGRIAAIENRPYNAFHGTKIAFFYYFDVVQDVQASRMLFDAAFEWARARGLDTMYGPNGLLRADGHGLLVEGFEHRPAIGIAYNYAYYGDLVEDAGFVKSHDYFSGHLVAGYDLPQRFYEIAERVKERRGLRVRSFRSRDELLTLAPVLHRIYEQAFVQVWGYYPVDQQEIETLIERISAIADPHLIKVVLKEEEPIGFIIAYPDVSSAIQRIKGRLWPLGWLQLLLERRRTEWVNFNGVGVLPKYQGVGANAVLYTELANTFKHNASRFRHGDVVQVAETNMHSLGDATAANITWYKRHRVYRRTL